MPSSPLGPASVHVSEANIAASAPGLCPRVPCVRAKMAAEDGGRVLLGQLWLLISPLPKGLGVLVREVLARGAPLLAKKLERLQAST